MGAEISVSGGGKSSKSGGRKNRKDAKETQEFELDEKFCADCTKTPEPIIYFEDIDCRLRTQSEMSGKNSGRGKFCADCTKTPMPVIYFDDIDCRLHESLRNEDTIDVCDNDMDSNSKAQNWPISSAGDCDQNKAGYSCGNSVSSFAADFNSVDWDSMSKHSENVDQFSVEEFQYSPMVDLSDIDVALSEKAAITELEKMENRLQWLDISKEEIKAFQPTLSAHNTAYEGFLKAYQKTIENLCKRVIA